MVYSLMKLGFINSFKKINILELLEEQKKDCKTETAIRMFYPEEVPEKNEDLQWIPLLG